MRKIFSVGVVCMALLAEVTISGTAYAAGPPGCSSVTQIGGTSYIRNSFDGETYVSVKQFKGCGKNWAYAYAWQSLVDGGAPFSLMVGIAVYWGPTAPEAGSYHGIVTGGYRDREVWSTGTDTLSQCTTAIADLRFDGEVSGTKETSLIC
jgi:hypothetical protein